MPTPRPRPPRPPIEPMLQAALEALPGDLGLTFETEMAPGEGGPDPILKVAWPGGQGRYRVHVQRIHRAEDLGHLRTRLAHPEEVLLLTPHLTAHLGQKCLELGLQFMDLAGNVHLKGQGLQIFVVGHKPKQGPDHRAKTFAPAKPFKAYNHKGLRVIFALLANPRMVGATYRELGRVAGVATGTVGLVMTDLLEAGLMALTPTARVLVQPERLVNGWVANYPHKLRPHLQPARFRAPHPAGWRGLNLGPHGAQWGGEVAGDRLTQHLKPLTATIYTGENPVKLAAALRLRPDPLGDIEILPRFWELPNPEGYPPDLVPPLLVYADLVASGDPRNADIARMIHDRHLHPQQPTP